jgi:5'-nucleotidase
VPGPIDVTVDVPEGYSVEAGTPQSATAKASATGSSAAEAGAQAAAATITLDGIPAGTSEVPITVTAPEDASGEVTVTTTLQAGEADWWDNNPMPLPHPFEATAQIVGGSGSDAGADADGGSADADGGSADADGGSADGSDQGGSDASSNGGSADGSDQGASDANGANATADGANASSNGGGAGSGAGSDSASNASGSKDGGDLPRTGFEALNLVATALALIVAGGAAIAVVRRRKANISI